MKVSTRDALSDLLLESLADPSLAAKLKQYGAVLTAWEQERQPSEATDLVIALQRGVFLFNHHLFFEVHEILEAQWLKETGEVKQFLQGLIQIAVAFYHASNDNLRGALALLHEGVEKITPHQPVFLGIELQKFIIALEACQAELRRLGPERLASFQTAMIPQLRNVAMTYLKGDSV